MKATLLLLTSLLLLCQYAVAHPAAPFEQRGGLSTQQRIQRASDCKGKLNGQAKQVVQQFCLGYLNGKQPQRSSTTSVVPATTTTTPVVTVQTTSVATEQATVTDTETSVITNSATVTVTATTLATSTTTKTTTSTQTVTAPLPEQPQQRKRRSGTSTFAQQLAKSFPSEVITDACLLYLYNTLAYPVVSVTTTATTTATAPAITTISSTATTTTATTLTTLTVPTVTVATTTASATTTQVVSVDTSSTTTTATTTVSAQLTRSTVFRLLANGVTGNQNTFNYAHTQQGYNTALLSTAAAGGVPFALERYEYPNQASGGSGSNGDPYDTTILAGYLAAYGLAIQYVIVDPSTGRLYVTYGPQYIPQGYDKVFCSISSAAVGVQLSCRGVTQTSYTTFYSCPNPTAGQDPVMYLLPANAAPYGCTAFTFTTLGL